MRDSISIIKRTFIEFFREKTLMHGAALAYYSLLALIPILYLSFTYIGVFIGDEMIILITSDVLTEYVGISDVSGILEFLNSVDLTKQSVFLQIVGVAALVFSASAIMNSLKKSINVFYDIQRTRLKKRQILLRNVLSRLMSISFVVGCTILVILLYFAETILLSVSSDLFENHHFLGWLFSAAFRHGSPILLNLLIFSFIFKYLHDGLIPWSMAIRGSALTSILLYIGQLLIKYYLINYFFAFESGIGGTLLILLVWVYYSSQIIFFGAKYIKVRSDFLGNEIKFRD